MALFQLTSRAYALLREVARSSTNAREVRRAQALLWLHENYSAQVVADRLGMSRQTVQRWKRQYQERAQDPVRARLQEGQHTGRLPHQLKLARKEIERVGGVIRGAMDFGRGTGPCRCYGVGFIGTQPPG